MGRVITQGTQMNMAVEASLGVLPGSPIWYELEPNSIPKFGTTVSKTGRSPISKTRARRKQSVTDLDSGVEIEADITMAVLRQFMSGFLFSVPVGPDSYMPSAVTGTGFTVTALSAAQAGRLKYGASAAKSLLFSYGWQTDANNGLKVLGGAAATSDTEIKVSGLTAEAGTATRIQEVMIAGVRGATGDLEIDSNGDLISTVLDFTTLGLSRGQQIHVGGVDSANQFTSPENTGFARLDSIAQHKLGLAKTDQAFVADNGAGVQIDILFGQFIRNVAVTHADFAEKSMQFELVSQNLMAGGATGYEYAYGNLPDAISFQLPLTGKATITMGFVGQNTTEPSTSRAAGAANAKAAGGLTHSFATASDIARIRAADIDEQGLTTDFKSATMTLSNQVSGEKVLGVLGPKYLNAGEIQLDIENQVVFSNPDLISRIKNNETISFDWIIRNDEGGIAFDIPTGTMQGGNREYPANQSVLLNDTFNAHQEPDLDFTLGVSFFPVLPPQ